MNDVLPFLSLVVWCSKKKEAALHKTVVRKAIFVDGASMLCTAEACGIRRIDYKGLYRILRQNVGRPSKHVRGPVIMSLPQRLKSNAGAHKLFGAMRHAGFTLVFADSTTEKDDEALIDSLLLYEVQQGDDIVVFSSDYDFVEVLRAKKRQGAHIHIVGTFGKGADSKVTIGDALKQILASGEFSFTDFRDIASSVALQMKRGFATSTGVTNGGFKIHVECPNDTWKRALLAELKMLSERFPGLRVSEVT